MKDIPFIVESTGDYHLLLTLELKKHGLNVKEINPIITRQYVRNSIRGTKTDKTDAEILAKIGVIEGEKFKTFNRSEEEILLKKKIALIANLETTLQSMKAGVRAYHEGLKKLGMQDSLNEDIGMAELMELDNLIKRLQQEVAEYVFQKQEDNENVARLHSIIGISKYMAVVFYVEFANKKFRSKEAMYAFVGCDPKLKQSGEKMVGVRMSKRGNAYTRKKLYQCAFCAKLHCKELGQIYEKAKERGKHYLIALNIIVKKLIHIMRGMMSNKTLFDPSLI